MPNEWPEVKKEAEEIKDPENTREQEDVENEKEEKEKVKKINIPEIGELQYTEKLVKFPEKTRQETGGVEGYIRKTISWEQLASFWDISTEEIKKIMNKGCVSREEIEEVDKKNDTEESEEYLSRFPKKESVDKFNKAKGTSLLVRVLTNHEFINQTLNHIVRRKSGEGISNLGKDRMLEKVITSRSIQIFDINNNHKLHPAEYLSRAGLPENLIKRYILTDPYERLRLFEKPDFRKDKHDVLYLSSSLSEGERNFWRKEIEINEEGREILNLSQLHKEFLEFGLSDEEKKVIKEKVGQVADVYLESDCGLNLTDPGEIIWSNYSFKDDNFDLPRPYDEVVDSTFPSYLPSSKGPTLSTIVLGFKMDTHNYALRRYCEKVKYLFELQGLDNKEIEDELRYDRSAGWSFRADSYKTLLALLEEIKIEKYKGRKAFVKVVGLDASDTGQHPRIPLIFNHPDIPELRWCHADYAFIPTKKGINIIEMIAHEKK